MGWILALVACTEAPSLGAEGDSPSATPPPDVSHEDVGEAVPGAPGDPGDAAYADLFDTRSLHTVRIDVPEGARAALGADPEGEVEVTVTVDGVRLDGVGLHLREATETLDAGQPALRLDLDAFADDQRLAGLEHLRLTSTPDDPTLLRAVLAGEILAALGVPAPRAAYAWVETDAGPLGLYVLEERVDSDFVQRWWPDDEGDLWEGARGADLREPGIERYARVHGHGRGGRVVLRQAAVALADPASEFVPAAEGVLDLGQWMTSWGAGIALRDGGAYPWDTGHDSLYVDPADGRLDTIPGDRDHVWDPLFSWREVRTQVGARCLADGACRGRLREVAGASIDAVEALDPVGRAEALRDLTTDAVQRDPRRGAAAESVDAAREVLLAELAGAAEAARADLGR